MGPLPDLTKGMTMNAYLGGDEAVIWPAAAASIFCLLLNAGLLRYLYYIERVRQ